MNRRDLAYRAHAPAKVNLVLRVGPLREDGYHELSTLLVPLDLRDELRVVVRRGRRGPVTCHVPAAPALDGPSNLASLAAEAFRRRFGVSDAIAITLEKRIPVTAGLGGGSSDAAAVLRALARAYAVRDGAELAATALEVGSDVPFFLGPGPAWAAGRGELLEPARVPRLHLVLVHPRDPALAIRAGDAYRWLDASRQAVAGQPAITDAPYGRHWDPSMAGNDLQGPCFERRPSLKRLVTHLVGQGATTAIMSGSGPTVFGIFADRATARRAASEAQGIGVEVDVHVVRTLQRHPGVSPWKSPRSAYSPSRRRSSRRT